MKPFQTLAFILFMLWDSPVNAQRIKGGAGFVKIGGLLLEQMKT